MAYDFELDDDTFADNFFDEIEEEDAGENVQIIDELRVGVVGYSDESEFEIDSAREILEKIIDQIEEEFIHTGLFSDLVIVSGLTNMGIPKLAYEIAQDRGYKTIGIAPNEAEDHDLFPVDEIIWSGESFGDESREFIDFIDLLVKVGGGDQSEKEVEMAEQDDVPVYVGETL
jgi:hypothetical protein